MGGWEGNGLTHQAEGSGSREAQLQCLVSAPVGSLPPDNAYLQEATRPCPAVMNQLWKGTNFKPSIWWLWVLCDTDSELRESPVPLTAVGSCALHRPWADL